MKVLITGAFGNIGQKVIQAVLDKNYQVICFDLNNAANQAVSDGLGNRVETVWGDITSSEQVAQVVARVDAVIHMAALLPATVAKNPALGEKVNIGGTKNVIAAIQACEMPPQLVFCSSVSVHGNNGPDDPHPRTINDPFHAEDQYAGHKIECERLIRESGIAATVVRIGACIDANSDLVGDPRDMILFLLSINPDCRLEYIHPKDVALALANAVNNPDAMGKIFLLGGGPSCQTTWREFTPMIFGALGIHNLPPDIFSKQSYYTEFMDTAEAQRVLQFQHHSLVDYRNEMAEKHKLTRRLLWPLRPLVKYWITSLAIKNRGKTQSH
jgi:nucleoside-diphosphate-sugar epimerase